MFHTMNRNSITDVYRERKSVQARFADLCEKAGPSGVTSAANDPKSELYLLKDKLQQLDAQIDDHNAKHGLRWSAPAVEGTEAPGNRGVSKFEVPKSFSDYLRTGSIEALADLTPSNDGAVLIPTTLSQEIFRNYSAYSPVEQVSRIIPTDDGEPFRLPKLSDSEEAELLGAAVDIGSFVPPTDLDATTFGAYKHSSKPVSVPRETLTDSAYDVGQEIVGALVARVMRLANKLQTTGNGTTQPEGFLTNCTSLDNLGTTLGLDDALDLIYAVPTPYRKPTNVFMASDVTIKFLRTLKTGITNDQTPLWQESPRAGEPARLYGYSVIPNNDMPNVASNGTIVDGCLAFGDFANAFIVRKADDARPFIVRYPIYQTDSTGFIVFQRNDSKLVERTAIVKLVVGGS